MIFSNIKTAQPLELGREYSQDHYFVSILMADVAPEGTIGNTQALPDESGGKLLNLSYINQSKTFTSHDRGAMPSSDLLGSSWDIDSGD